MMAEEMAMRADAVGEAEAATDVAEAATETAASTEATAAAEAAVAGDLLDAAERQAARRYLYAMGQLLLGSEPTVERLENVQPDLLPEALAAVGLTDDRGVAAAIERALGESEAECARFTRLFIGPATPKATPWESTYRSRSKALFRQETLDVRNAYRAQGFLPQAYPKVADDHIAIELGFLAALAAQSLEALQVGDAEAAARADEASLAFLNQHLLTWAEAYADDLDCEAPGSLYAAVARLMADLAHADAVALAEA